MSIHAYRFRNLCTLVDEVHLHFARMRCEGAFNDVLGHNAFYRLQWAVHEWMANLVQHADFDGQTPDIHLALTPKNASVNCKIDDNSLGFDLEEELRRREQLLKPLPERGMGLLILDSCAQDLSYDQVAPTLHRLEFNVTTQQDPWLNIPFSS